MNTAGVMVIFRQHIKATISLLCLIVSDYDVMSMSSEFQDWIIKYDMAYKVCTTYYSEVNDQTEGKNRELTEICAANKLEGTDWLPTEPKVWT